MKKATIISFILSVLASGMHAETLRVNNIIGSGAQYSSFEEAQSAAQDGDIIIVDGSESNYGKIKIEKKITLKGPGYFLGENDVTKEGESVAKFSSISVMADGAKVTGVVVDGEIALRANDVVITRCHTNSINLCSQYSYSEDHITRGVIHQNYIVSSISGDSYSASATYMQVTNNIISRGYNASLCNLDNSVISRNTIVSSERGVRQLTNCVIENNIGVDLESSYYNNKNNSYSNNHDIKDSNEYKLYGSNSVDSKIKEVDTQIGTDLGAFSGDDPYVLSGIPTGPVIQDITMPESVVQGEHLKVTVKINMSL